MFFSSTGAKKWKRFYFALNGNEQHLCYFEHVKVGYFLLLVFTLMIIWFNLYCVEHLESSVFPDAVRSMLMTFPFND